MANVDHNIHFFQIHLSLGFVRTMICIQCKERLVSLFHRPIFTLTVFFHKWISLLHTSWWDFCSLLWIKPLARPTDPAFDFLSHLLTKATRSSGTVLLILGPRTAHKISERKGKTLAQWMHDGVRLSPTDGVVVDDQASERREGAAWLSFLTRTLRQVPYAVDSWSS